MHLTLKDYCSIDGRVILCQEPVPYLPDDTFDTVYENVLEWSPKLFLQALDELETRQTEFIPPQKMRHPFFRIPPAKTFANSTNTI